MNRQYTAQPGEALGEANNVSLSVEPRAATPEKHTDVPSILLDITSIAEDSIFDCHVEKGL